MTELFALHEVQQPGREISMIVRPRTIDEALRLLVNTPDARPLAGGTDLLLDLQRSGPGDPVTVVDLSGIYGFRAIVEEEDAFVLGGGVMHNQVVADEAIRTSALPLAQACAEIGSPQLRNRATIAGNLVTASPANDSISALMALDASLELSRLDGDVAITRMVAVTDFFTGFRSTILEPGELITSIRVPKLAAHERGIWVKLGLRKAQAISVVHAGLVIGIEREIVTNARLSLGSVAPTVVMVDEFSDALIGRRFDSEAISGAASAAAEAVAPIDDGRATADYRRDGVAMLVDRSLRTLERDEQASMWLQDTPTLSTPSRLATAATVPQDEVERVSVTVNGTVVSGSRATLTLLDWLREFDPADESVDAFPGSKEGCAEGECGACTVILDGAAVMSCLVAAGQADGGTIVTVEGLGHGGALHPIQQAFIEDFAVQCGFCIPGFLVAGARLLEENPEPDDDQIRLGLSGNLCRCTGYYPIIDAVRNAGERLR